MLTIVTGPFHPNLEQALVTEVTAIKRDDPLRPLAVLVPSEQLARRVKRLLAVERGLTLLEVHVLTFHQLAVALLRETPSSGRPALVDGVYREELLRYLVATGVPGAEVFRDWADLRGIWGGLWATMQDLKEARVDPRGALTAVEERLLGADDPARLKGLLRLYASVLQADRVFHLADPDDLAALAVGLVPDSEWLKRMARVCYYGFYDLTQGQLDFFKAVASAHPTTVFFPLRPKSPAFRFAQRFFETYLTGLSGGENPSTPSPAPWAFPGSLADEMAPEVRATCRVLSAVGPEDEVSAAAKEILHLIEERAVEPMEIGVVARALDPYLRFIRRVFDENRIPFACPLGEPLIHDPLVKTVVRFLRLPVEGFPRAAVIEVLASPACRLSTLSGSSALARPDRWDRATRRLGITRGDPEDGGLGEWRRLERAAQRGLNLPRLEEAESIYHTCSPDELNLLWHLVRGLHADLSSLPERAGWGDYVAAFARLLPMYFDFPAVDGSAPAEEAGTVQAAVLECLQSAERLAQLDEEVSLGECTEFLVRLLERAQLPSTRSDLPGVQVLDAKQARGLPFRALFVLGLNEKVFPRSLQEDAFLRDADRDVLARDLGYKIERKQEDGFEEERLLFALLLRSARERLYLSYQRADRDGRIMVPSGYLAELKPLLAQPDRPLRRRPTERWAERPFAWTLLTPGEAGLQMILESSGVGTRTFPPSLERCLRLRQEPDLFDQGVEALAALDSMKPGLTPYDGLVGPGLAHWRGLEQHGVSPTALEAYAQCPFRYFAEKVLRFEPLETPESVSELEAKARGNLCHVILRVFYERLFKSGIAPGEAASSDVDAWLDEAADGAFARFEASEPVGYPLLWSLAKEDVVRLLKTFVHDDLEELRASGYRPALFEVAVRGRFGPALADTLKDVPIRGRVDRVDVTRKDGKAHVRVVDYKYTESAAPKPEDRDLATAALRGKRLQPPLYLLAAKSVLGEEPAVPDAAAFYFLAPHWPNGPVDRTVLTTVCGEETVRVILEGVRDGRFFILPGDYCKHCEFSAACRRSHHPTKWREREDKHKQVLEDVRRQKARTT
jgi:ATP-dependent helicase/nuclease subunit B